MDAWDPAEMAHMLGSLANPVRLRLILALQTPRAAGELRLPPTRGGQAGSPARNISRQAIERHLRQLCELGVVTGSQRQIAGRSITAYQVNPARMFALTEELRRLGHLDAAVDDALEGTLPGPVAANATNFRGPSLFVVRGVGEGKSLPLIGSGPWSIGRAQGCELRIEHDPYISLRHAHISRADGAFYVTDQEGSRNGTALNMLPLERGVSAPVISGDLIGLGRTLLWAQL